jgi:putative DNA-invertase from lambdoid prophage Rac
MNTRRSTGSVRAAIYARVSTTDQNCEMQLRELRDYCEHRGWRIADEYVDTGWSGAKASRPQLDRLMKDARQRRFDAVLVWKLDRWGRSLIHSLQSVQELASLGVRFAAITQNIDTDQSNPMSRFMLHIFGAFAEFEREMIRERVSAGIQNAKRKGKQRGRKRVVFDRSRAREMQQAGATVREIASALKIGRGTVQRLLAQKPSESASSNPLESQPAARS